MEKDLRIRVGIEPAYVYLYLGCDALPIELPSPWEQGGGEEGYTSASFWCPCIPSDKLNNPWVTYMLTYILDHTC